MKRIVIPVSNVLRDLHGDVLLAVTLARRGFTTYLVPTRRLREIFAIAPDMLLLHQFRVNQEDFTRKLLDCGMQVSVLDVEGMEQIDKYARMTARDGDLKRRIKRFMTWGTVVAEFLKTGGGYSADQVMITGSPRHDFYVEPLRRASLHVNGHAAKIPQPMILINANFPYANHPTARAGSDAASKEGESLGIKDLLLEEKEQQTVAMRHMVEIANTLAARFPQATVVYRPHPFEDLDTYKMLLDARENLQLIREGSVDGWILRASAVIQRACTTAVESALAGVPTLSPRWFDARDYPVPESVSVPAGSMDALIQQVEQALNRRMVTPESVREQVAAVTHDWFYCMDGRSHERVATVLANDAKDADGANIRACLTELYRLDRDIRGTRSKIARQMRYWLRLSAETGDQYERRETNVNAAVRRFMPDEVEMWINAINAAQQMPNDVRARAMRRTDVIAPMQTYHTVVVEPT